MKTAFSTYETRWNEAIKSHSRAHCWHIHMAFRVSPIYVMLCVRNTNYVQVCVRTCVIECISCGVDIAVKNV